MILLYILIGLATIASFVLGMFTLGWLTFKVVNLFTKETFKPDDKYEYFTSGCVSGLVALALYIFGKVVEVTWLAL